MYKVTTFIDGRDRQGYGHPARGVFLVETLAEALSLQPLTGPMARLVNRIVKPINRKGMLVAYHDGSFEVLGYHAPFLALVDRWVALDVPDRWNGARFEDVLSHTF